MAQELAQVKQLLDACQAKLRVLLTPNAAHGHDYQDVSHLDNKEKMSQLIGTLRRNAERDRAQLAQQQGHLAEIRALRRQNDLLRQDRARDLEQAIQLRQERALLLQAGSALAQEQRDVARGCQEGLALANKSKAELARARNKLCELQKSHAEAEAAAAALRADCEQLLLQRQELEEGLRRSAEARPQLLAACESAERRACAMQKQMQRSAVRNQRAQYKLCSLQQQQQQQQLQQQEQQQQQQQQPQQDASPPMRAVQHFDAADPDTDATEEEDAEEGHAMSDDELDLFV